ncbi:hypothetical protein FACS1894166_07510 [Bacilli bacterium]|nr:hypothetical protein FACS1894166_07510 [Bacilli bacterium]
MHNYQAQIQNNNVLCYQANQFYDMGDMIQEVSAGQSSSTYFTTTDAKATAVINNIKAAVVYEQHMSYNAGSTGLSIFCTNPTNVTGNNRGYYNTAYLGVYEAVNLKTNTNWTPY